MSLGPEMENDAKEKSAQRTGPVYSLEPLVVELAGRYLKVSRGEEGRQPLISTRKKYLCIVVDLELKDEKAIIAVKKRLPQIRDAISEKASSKTVKDIEKIDGKKVLSDEIFIKLNRILREDIVTDVFFSEFTVQ